MKSRQRERCLRRQKGSWAEVRFIKESENLRGWRQEKVTEETLTCYMERKLCSWGQSAVRKSSCRRAVTQQKNRRWEEKLQPDSYSPLVFSMIIIVEENFAESSWSVQLFWREFQSSIKYLQLARIFFTP